LSTSVSIDAQLDALAWSGPMPVSINAAKTSAAAPANVVRLNRVERRTTGDAATSAVSLRIAGTPSSLVDPSRDGSG
jgi:hypothetical protein